MHVVLQVNHVKAAQATLDTNMDRLYETARVSIQELDEQLWQARRALHSQKRA